MISRLASTLLPIALLVAMSASAADLFDIGLATSGARIDAITIESHANPTRTVVLIGGLHGEDDSTAKVRAALAAYEKSPDRKFQLLAVPLANPDGVALSFPPTGIAYRENAESHVLWRWLGSQAPDLVLIAGEDSGLAAALDAQRVADMGHIPARQWNAGPTKPLAAQPGGIA